MYLNVFTEVMVVGGQVLSNSLIFFYLCIIYLFIFEISIDKTCFTGILQSLIRGI